MNRMLTIVMFLVLTITALGIVGLASFSVTQRRRQIGTRRAIGAQKVFTSCVYFLVENWLVTTGGVVLGLALTFALNYQLITEYNLPRLDPVWLPAVVLGLWAVGLLAAMGPARTRGGYRSRHRDPQRISTVAYFRRYGGDMAMILVIDDNDGVRDALRLLLDLHGFEVVTAADTQGGVGCDCRGPRRPGHPGHELRRREDLGGGRRAVVR